MKKDDMIIFIIETIYRYVRFDDFQKQLIIFNLLVAYSTQIIRKIYIRIGTKDFSNYTLGKIIDWLIEIGG